MGGTVKQVKEKQGKDGKEKQGKDKDKQGKDKDKNRKDGKDGDGKKDFNNLRPKPGTEQIGGGILGLQGETAEDQSYAISPERSVFLVTLKMGADAVTEPPGDELMSRHLAHITALRDEGRLDSVASFASGDGGILILIAESEDEAIEAVKRDPLVEAGYYEGFDIKRLLLP